MWRLNHSNENTDRERVMQSRESEEEGRRQTGAGRAHVAGKALLFGPGRGMGVGRMLQHPSPGLPTRKCGERRKAAQLALPILPTGSSSSANLGQRSRHTGESLTISYTVSKPLQHGRE